MLRGLLNSLAPRNRLLESNGRFRLRFDIVDAPREPFWKIDYYSDASYAFGAEDTVAEAYRAIDFYAANRLRRWLCVKHKVKGGGSIRFSYEHLYQRMGLIRLSKLPRSPLWAKA